MKAVLVGYGEVGKGLYEVFRPFHKIEIQDPPAGYGVKGKFEVMLIALPYSKIFVELVKKYQERYKPEVTIIFSTVPIGTCRLLGAVHSPVEGIHPKLAESIKIHTRWIGGRNSKATVFLLEAMLKLKLADQPEYTEFLKLRSLAVYALNIEFARYSKGVADGLGMDYFLVNSYDRDYNDLNMATGNSQYSRYVLYPPKDKIGGHCILKGVALLGEQHPSSLLDEILRRNHDKP